jgi:hypothetical protein
MEKYSSRVTVSELVDAGLLSERWLFLGAMTESYCQGAYIVW